MITAYNFVRANLNGIKAFKVYRENEVRYTLESSVEQCKGRFSRGDWSVTEISIEEYARLMFGI
jgi:hypothetical protein